MTRLKTPKTYKAYIGGQFARSESGRHFDWKLSDDTTINLPLCSRKDVRNAVAAARKGMGKWAGKTAFNRSQILYRIAEMLEGRFEQFVAEMSQNGMDKTSATDDVAASIDLCIYYAGWCDKYSALAGTVNPVSTGHFNFTVPEPYGVVGIVSPDSPSLLKLLASILPAVAGGNVAVVILPRPAATIGLSFSEVLHTSDVPGTAIQFLSGDVSEMGVHLSGHADVDSLVTCIPLEDNAILEACAHNLKPHIDWAQRMENAPKHGLQMIVDVQQFKTTWHPVAQSLGGGGGY